MYLSDEAARELSGIGYQCHQNEKRVIERQDRGEQTFNSLLFITCHMYCEYVLFVYDI